ncbi:hypothetical protein AB205_0073020, partial [Aquarana catesbeiana]
IIKKKRVRCIKPFLTLQHDESAVSIANAKFTRPSCSVSEFLLSMRGTFCVGTGHTRSELTRSDFVVGKFYLLLSNFVCQKIRWKMSDGAHTRSEFPTTCSDRTFSIGKSDRVYGALDCYQTYLCPAHCTFSCLMPDLPCSSLQFAFPGNVPYH